MLLQQLEGLAHRQPVLMIFEDVHWIDPTSLELLELVVQRVQFLPVLLVITCRPEFAPAWSGQAHVTTLSLSRLSRRHGAGMVREVTGGKPLPTQLSDLIVEHTDGVPLFLEELTKSVLEGGLVRDEGSEYVLTGPLPALAIPTTLHDSLMARLDRLAPIREVVQIGAALGREFSFELLAAVAPLSDSALQNALTQLVGSELVFCRGAPPHATYIFKHALVQDTAYDTLLKSKRHQLHARITQVLEERFADIVEAEPELLAHHCTRAGLPKKAIEYRLKAGQLAMTRSAITEAMVHFTNGLTLLADLPDEAERRRQELRVQVALGRALYVGGHREPEGGRAFARAHELCRELGDTSELLPTLWGVWAFHFNRGEPSIALEVAEDLVHRAESLDDPAGQMIGHRLLGAALYVLGRLSEARVHLEKALAFYDPVQDRDLAALYGYDVHVTVLYYLSITLVPLGYPCQAVRLIEQALADARELCHVPTLAFALDGVCQVHELLNDQQAVLDRVDELIALAMEQGFEYWLPLGLCRRGWALTEMGRIEDGKVQLQQGIAALKGKMIKRGLPQHLAHLAQACTKAGSTTEGLALLTEAFDNLEPWYESELHRLKGELLLSLPDACPAGAEACFNNSLAAARKQSARLWELRAAASLSRLWRSQHRQAEACDLLTPIYDWFTEGFDTRDLKEAQALLGTYK